MSTQEDKTIAEGNKMICEFMGLVRYNEKGHHYEYGYYHQQWQYLMEVVEKIELGNYGFKMCRKVVEIYWDDSKELILKRKEKSRIESLWVAVVDFILWHNNLPLNNNPNTH